MKNIHAIAVSVLIASAVSCTEPIMIDRVDEGDYNNVVNLIGSLRDGKTGKTSTVVDMYSEDFNSEVAFNLARAPKAGVDVKVIYDKEYAARYNEEHGTSFEALPESRFTIANEGRIVVAPDEKASYRLGISIAAPAAFPSEDRTYILPLKAEVTSGPATLSEDESHCVYLVKETGVSISEGYEASKYAGTAFREEGEKQTVLFFEVNDTNPLNALQFQMEDGRYLWNYVVLFAANINYDKEKGEVYIYCNDQVQYILDHNEEIIQPLRKRGIKVLLSILGNHDESGLAQLSEIGAKQFAQKVKNICDAYGLDGINYDDEYSNSPDLSNPLFTQRSYEAGARLMFETKQVMPERTILSYQFGKCVGADYVDGIPSNEWLDIVVGDYEEAGVPYAGMTLANCAAMSYEIAQGRPTITLEGIRAHAESDYGYVMAFGLWASGNQGSQRQFNNMDILAKGLYDCPLKKPEYYYPSSTSMETSNINW